MHPLALQLAPVLAAEKSKVPFYIVGGLLVVWAFTLSLLLGLRNPRFPGSLAGQRAVIAISAILVAGTLAAAVLTAEPPAKGPVPAPTVNAAIPQTFPVVASGAPAAAATPSSSSSSAAVTTAAGTKVSLEANPTGLLAYNTKSLSAKAGTVTIVMANMSPLEHNVTVAEGSKVLGATPTFKGGTRSLTLKLKPGKYTFYCSVPGHRAAGMEGTLTVS